MSALKELCIEPSSALRRWVTGIRIGVPKPGAQYDVAHLPDAEPTLLFRATSDSTGTLSIVGPRTRARYKSTHAMPFYVRVGLRAGCARSLIDLPVSEIANDVVPLRDVWGLEGEMVRDRLLGRAPHEVARALETVLLQRLSRIGELPHGLVDRALALLGASPSTSVASLASSLGVSVRHLRRVFANEVGMAPKLYARIARVRKALNAPQPSGWAERALAAGFHDQAHLISDFRDLLGATPAAFAAGRTPPARSCGDTTAALSAARAAAP